MKGWSTKCGANSCKYSVKWNGLKVNYLGFFKHLNSIELTFNPNVLRFTYTIVATWNQWIRNHITI